MALDLLRCRPSALQCSCPVAVESQSLSLGAANHLETSCAHRDQFPELRWQSPALRVAPVRIIRRGSRGEYVLECCIRTLCGLGGTGNPCAQYYENYMREIFSPEFPIDPARFPDPPFSGQGPRDSRMKAWVREDPYYTEIPRSGMACIPGQFPVFPGIESRNLNLGTAHLLHAEYE
ncbi:hypothetical protein C7212DRAFT_346464 [Tuber magnatum]|uniref:Uncharacterized protein n=1 Tax=Tuber magnatum TaxID=42249 RepID=A0A317SIC6_9PEZI|nr:hypothetical protein C7212DRAFT_346464 [Tuber magnatum]